MDKLWRQKLLNRFLIYTKMHSESKAFMDEIPSTERQWDIAKYLKNDLEEIGMEKVSIDGHAYVMAELPANTDKNVSSIGFIAHFDTSPDFTGKNVQPQIHENYDGNRIVLKENRVISPEDFPNLKEYVGKTLITSDGTTLLGADDKAGVAEIVTAMEYLTAHPEIEHGRIAVCFTPDEEVGRGAELFNVEKFNCEWAYTMDGSVLGELEYENFNAAFAKIKIHGKSVHPGSAKDKMINAGQLAARLAAEFPANETPETTEGREGFYHQTYLNGEVSYAELQYIIRDHDMEKFKARKTFVEQKVKMLQDRVGEDFVELEIQDQYYNMKLKVEEKPESIAVAKRAMEKLGITIQTKPIRGGTDGSQLSFKGLPCPNIFAGGENFHGPYEFAVLETMEKATEVIITIAQELVK